MTNLAFFFFSSRRRHTIWNCDWSSDVCSSDLELAEEVVAAAEQRLEEIEGAGHRPAQLLDPPAVGLRLAELCLDLVRRALPDAVEPVEEDLELGAAGRVGRVERRLRVALFEVGEDPGRVEDDRAVVVDHRHEILPAQPTDRAPVLPVDHDRLGLDPLVRERERDPLDVGRERDPVQADQATTSSTPTFSPRLFWSAGEAKPSRPKPRPPRNAASAGFSARGFPSSTLSATPSPSGEAAQISPSAPRLAAQPGSSCISWVSYAPSPPISSGRAR